MYHQNLWIHHQNPSKSPFSNSNNDNVGPVSPQTRLDLLTKLPYWFILSQPVPCSCMCKSHRSTKNEVKKFDRSRANKNDAVTKNPFSCKIYKDLEPDRVNIGSK